MARHCMVVDARYPFGETRVQRQAEALIERGYEVDVICLRGPDEPRHEVVNRVGVHRVGRQRPGGGALRELRRYLAFFLVAAWRVTTLHRRRRYDVVQVHNLPDFLVFCAVVPRWLGASVLLDIHDLMPEFYVSRFDRSAASLGARLLRLQERWACRFADHVVTVTEAWRETLVGRAVAEEKCSVVMNLADDRIFRPVPRPARSPGEPGFRLLYHGTFAHRYGLDLLVRAVAELGDELAGLEVILHGWGPSLPRLRELVERLGLEGTVRFDHQRLPLRGLRDLIASADVGVVPNRADPFTDAILPTKLLEWTAVGLPAIAARTSAIARYFDETMVRFFEPGDHRDLARAIRELYADRVQLVEIARNADRFNRIHSWSEESERYAALVASLR